MAAYWNLIAKTGPGGGAMGAVVQYNILLAKLYAIATVSVATMTAGAPEDAREAIANYACSAAQGLALGLAGSAGEVADFINNASALKDGSSAFGGC